MWGSVDATRATSRRVENMTFMNITSWQGPHLTTSSHHVRIRQRIVRPSLRHVADISELERQKIIAENRALLDSLGFDEGGDAKLNLAPPPKPAASRKRKTAPVKVESEGPRRRSGRIAGLEADGYEMALKQEAEARVVEEARERDRKLRKQVMPVAEMVEGESEGEKGQKEVVELQEFLPSVAEAGVGRSFPSVEESAREAYADAERLPVEVQRLKEAFKGVALRANTKVTSERVFSMVVHPEPTKNLVLVGDKYGQLGM